MRNIYKKIQAFTLIREREKNNKFISISITIPKNINIEI